MLNCCFNAAICAVVVCHLIARGGGFPPAPQQNNIPPREPIELDQHLPLPGFGWLFRTAFRSWRLFGVFVGVLATRPHAGFGLEPFALPTLQRGVITATGKFMALGVANIDSDPCG